ncbi:MAG: M48 family metallopeptidase, partial [Bacteroidales bacterium]|nr:M48 family metallopeptidase [Bacteroidales bacterium]
MYNIVFYIIIGILLFGYLLDQFLVYLNSTMWSNKLPKELEGIYDAEKYMQSQNYEKVNNKFSLISSSFNLILMFLMLFLGGFAFVDNIARNLVDQYIIIALVFFGILMFASDLINTPFSIYDTFVIEEKFGFNKTTTKTFILDKLKSWMLAIIIGGGLLALVIWFYLRTTDMFWIYTWTLATAFSIFMTMFYSTLIVPIFNKQTPLESGELRIAIEEFCKKAGFKLDNVYVIDGSKRSTKANAYFSGLGPKKRIVLFDTLINDLTTEEIVAVLAHEIGHYKKRHMLWMILFS